MPTDKLKVLVVEDSPSDLRLLQEALKPHMNNEFELIGEPNLEGGLRCIAAGQIDLVLLDLFLPESSGLETLEKMRQAAPETPIIILTGVYTDWLAIHALRLGAYCFLNKDWLNGKNLAQAFRYYAELKRAV